MIDLAAAYRQVDELLAARGRRDVPYCINVVLWNHRRGDSDVAFRISAMTGPSGCIQAYDRPTLEDAVATLARLLDEHLAPKPEAFTDLRVELPQTADPAEIAEAADAASQPF